MDECNENKHLSGGEVKLENRQREMIQRQCELKIDRKYT